MSKVVKFVYISLNSNDKFQEMRKENKDIVPCSLYVDNKEQKVYFVEEKTGAIMDFDIDISDRVLGL